MKVLIESVFAFLALLLVGVYGKSYIKTKQCYQCAWAPDKLVVRTEKVTIRVPNPYDPYKPKNKVVTRLVSERQSGGWEACEGPFSYYDALDAGIDLWDCEDNCMTRVDQNGNVFRGCYRGEFGVDPDREGCQNVGDSMYCFCKGERCNNDRAPTYKTTISEDEGKHSFVLLNYNEDNGDKRQINLYNNQYAIHDNDDDISDYNNGDQNNRYDNHRDDRENDYINRYDDNEEDDDIDDYKRKDEENNYYTNRRHRNRNSSNNIYRNNKRNKIRSRYIKYRPRDNESRYKHRSRHEEIVDKVEEYPKKLTEDYSNDDDVIHGNEPGTYADDDIYNDNDVDEQSYEDETTETKKEDVYDTASIDTHESYPQVTKVEVIDTRQFPIRQRYQESEKNNK